MVLFLCIVIVAIALGITGAVVHGLLFLLIIGIVLFLTDFILLGSRLRARRHRIVR